MKRVLRVKGNLYFDSDKWTEKEIVEFLEKKVGMYGITVVSNMSLKECPNGWKPRQQTLNGKLRRE